MAYEFIILEETTHESKFWIFIEKTKQLLR